jgi:hypothetical protein
VAVPSPATSTSSVSPSATHDTLPVHTWQAGPPPGRQETAAAAGAAGTASATAAATAAVSAAAARRSTGGSFGGKATPALSAGRPGT